MLLFNALESLVENFNEVQATKVNLKFTRSDLHPRHETLELFKGEDLIVKLRHENVGNEEMLASGLFTYIMYFGLRPSTETVKPSKKIINGN